LLDNSQHVKQGKQVPEDPTMQIAIIGAGNVGRALAGSLTRAGHDVTVSAVARRLAMPFLAASLWLGIAVGSVVTGGVVSAPIARLVAPEALSPDGSVTV